MRPVGRTTGSWENWEEVSQQHPLYEEGCCAQLPTAQPRDRGVESALHAAACHCECNHAHAGEGSTAKQLVCAAGVWGGTDGIMMRDRGLVRQHVEANARVRIWCALPHCLIDGRFNHRGEGRVVVQPDGHLIVRHWHHTRERPLFAHRINMKIPDIN